MMKCQKLGLNDKGLIYLNELRIGSRVKSGSLFPANKDLVPDHYLILARSKAGWFCSIDGHSNHYISSSDPCDTQAGFIEQFSLLDFLFRNLIFMSFANYFYNPSLSLQMK